MRLPPKTLTVMAYRGNLETMMLSRNSLLPKTTSQLLITSKDPEVIFFFIFCISVALGRISHVVIR